MIVLTLPYDPPCLAGQSKAAMHNKNAARPQHASISADISTVCLHVFPEMNALRHRSEPGRQIQFDAGIW